MPEYNLIQRPDLIDRMRRFLGLRQKSTTPTLATTLQPVIVLADLDNPIRLGSRRACNASTSALGLAGQQLAIGLTIGSALPRVKLYANRVWLSSGSVGAPHSVSDYWHPATPTVLGQVLDSGTGGDNANSPPVGRGGLNVDTNGGGIGGMISGKLANVPIPPFPNVLEIDMRGLVLTSENVMPGAPGGQGAGYYFALDQAGVFELFSWWWWEEEFVTAVGSP